MHKLCSISTDCRCICLSWSRIGEPRIRKHLFLVHAGRFTIINFTADDDFVPHANVWARRRASGEEQFIWESISNHTTRVRRPAQPDYGLDLNIYVHVYIITSSTPICSHTGAILAGRWWRVSATGWRARTTCVRAWWRQIRQRTANHWRRDGTGESARNDWIQGSM